MENTMEVISTYNIYSKLYATIKEMVLNTAEQ